MRSRERTYQTYFLSRYEQVLYDRLASIIRIHSPLILGLMVDGVPPTAKANEQRRRRRNNVAPHLNWLKQLSSTAITPGTDLMIYIDGLIQRFLINPAQYLIIDGQDMVQQPMKIIYSNHLDPGEGEQKILKYLRDKTMYPHENVSHIVYSNDNDMFLLLPRWRDSGNISQWEQMNPGIQYQLPRLGRWWKI